MITRRNFFRTACATPACVAPFSAAAQSSQPNIILTMTDDQGWGDTSYNGHPVLKTPNLDKMAAAGIRFDRFYAGAAVCSPTRGSVLTGRSPNRFHCFSWGYDLPLREVTIAEAVKTAGYTTGHFGKWHLGGIPFSEGGDNRGFVAEPPGPPEKSARHPGNQGFDEWFSAGNWFDLDYEHMYHNGNAVGPLKGAPADLVMDRAIQFIRSASARNRPFLAVIWFPEPHGPHIALEKDKAPYRDYPKDADYFGEINAVDRNMGRLREELRTLNIHRNTMLWFNSDNGATRLDATGGLSGGKGNLMEGGLRVPGILEWPARIPKPFISRVPACTVDFYPTVCDLLKIHMSPRAGPIDGISLLPLIDGKMDRRPKPLGFEIRHPDGHVISAALIDNDWKLYRGKVLHGWPAKPEGAIGDHLFDLERDPAEHDDISAGRPSETVRLGATLDEWQRSVAKDLAAYPSTNPKL